MRNVSQTCRDVLESGSFSAWWVGDLFYDGVPKAQNLLLMKPGFSWDSGAQIQGKGSCEVLWDDMFGQSIVPREIGDLFSPYGAELQADVIISAGDFSERIPMGRFVLDSVPDSVERTLQAVHGGAPIVVESRVSLDLADYFLRIARDEFAFPASPQSTSMWDEAQRLTGLSVVRSIADRVLPRNITYDEDRLEALDKVFGPSNAWPALTPSGGLTAVPKAWPAPVGRLTNVSASPIKMRSENVYNRVVVEGKNPVPDGPVLRAIREVRQGFLRTRNANGTRSPFGGATYRYKSEFLTTQAQVDQRADDLLPQVSQIRSVTRTITEPFNPLRELGDVLVHVDSSRGGDESLVRVTGIRHDVMTELDVEVATK